MALDMIYNAHSDVMPALVRLYDAQKVEDLARSSGEESRGELLEIVSSLLAMDLSPRESELIADVLICLMRQVQQDVCIALSEKLALFDNVPLRLLMHIANEAIDIARPVLKNSPVFNDMDLIYIIKSKSADYWQAIAQRHELGEDVTLSLLATGDSKTAYTLVANQNTYLEKNCMMQLSERAIDDEVLAKALLQRNEITSDILRVLYEGVGAALRHYIERKFDYVADLKQVNKAIDDIVLEFCDLDEPVSEDSVEAVAIAREADVLINEPVRISRFVSYLEKGAYKEFVEHFSAYCGVSQGGMMQITTQSSGQALAIICKAMNIDRRDFVTLYLLMHRMRKENIVDPKKLKRAAQYYDTMARDSAEFIMNKIRSGQVSFGS